jgi:Spy/CpxP family protein refolding chaperone
MASTSFDRRALRGLLFGVALAIAGTASLTAWAQPHGPHAGHGDHGGFMHGRGLERMLDAANASEAQRTQIRQIAQAAAADLKSQREAGRALRERQMQLFTQPTIDANAVESLRQQQLAQHDQASKRMTQALLDISRVLTAEQRVKIAERMKARRDMMERHHQERMEQDHRQ